MLHEELVVPVPLYGSETMIGKEKDSSRMRIALVADLRGLLGIRRKYRVPNECYTK